MLISFAIYDLHTEAGNNRLSYAFWKHVEIKFLEDLAVSLRSIKAHIMSSTKPLLKILIRNIILSSSLNFRTLYNNVCSVMLLITNRITNTMYYENKYIAVLILPAPSLTKSIDFELARGFLVAHWLLFTFPSDRLWCYNNKAWDTMQVDSPIELPGCFKSPDLNLTHPSSLLLSLAPWKTHPICLAWIKIWSRQALPCVHGPSRAASSIKFSLDPRVACGKANERTTVWIRPSHFARLDHV